MRKLMISLLMASAAASPTIAHAQDSASERRAERQKARSERQAAREDRSSMREDRSSAREERSAAREDRSNMRRQQTQNAQSQSVDNSAMMRRHSVDTGAQRPAIADIRQNRVEQRAQLQESREARKARYAALREARRGSRPPVVSATPQPNTQPPAPTVTRHTTTPTWNTGWRHNNHYNWYNHRKRNRWLFSLGFYNDPFGWGYSPFSIGWRMWPSYYSQSYWLNDPWQYRLPYAPPGTRWIRYYDDAILVDTWNGQVLDVIYDFFW